MLWQLGMLAGGISSMYFAANAFLPAYLAHIGRADRSSEGRLSASLGADHVRGAHLPQEAKREEAMRLAANEARRPFDLALGPLLRATLVQLEPDAHLHFILQKEVYDVAYGFVAKKTA